MGFTQKGWEGESAPEREGGVARKRHGGAGVRKVITDTPKKGSGCPENVLESCKDMHIYSK